MVHALVQTEKCLNVIKYNVLYLSVPNVHKIEARDAKC